MSTTDPCTNLILIGMAGTGKTTLGKMAAGALSWCHIDTDYLLQSWWGMSLQALRDRLGLEAFLQAEADMLTRLKVCRCVISTGGSVVYRRAGMRRLKELGPAIELFADLETISSRLQNPDSRGLAVRPGQTLEELYHERRPLYAAYADARIDTGKSGPETCVKEILAWLKKR